MTTLFIFISGVFISLLTVTGFVVSIREFKYMGEHPEEYPKDFSNLRDTSQLPQETKSDT